MEYLSAVWTGILDDERRNGWANTAGSTAQIVVPIRQAVVDRLLGRVAWPRVVEQLYVRLADDNRLELMVVASLLGFRKRFDARLRLDPVFDRTSSPRVSLTFEHAGLLTTALAMAGSAITLPRGVRLESGRVVFDPDELASAAGYGDVSRHLTRAEFAIRDGVLWITAALAIAVDRQTASPPPVSAPESIPDTLPFDVSDLLQTLGGAHATFALRLTDRLINRLIAAGTDVWRSGKRAFAGLPPGLDGDIEELAVEFESGWMVVKGSAGLKRPDRS